MVGTKSNFEKFDFFWKIDEIWRILAIFQFLKNITLCGLNRQQFWLEHFFCNSPKNSLKFAKFWQFFKKKKSNFLLQKWIVHGWYKNQKNVENFGNFDPFWPYLENCTLKWDLSIFWSYRTPRRYIWKIQIFSNFFQFFKSSR